MNILHRSRRCIEGHDIHSAVLVPTLPFAAIHFLPVSLDLWKVATEYMLGKACIAEVRSAAPLHLLCVAGGVLAAGLP